MQKLTVVPLCAAMLAGCGTYRTAPVAPTSDWPVAPESRVRIVATALGDKKQIGIAISATHDTLFFRQDMQTNVRPISVRDIRQLEIAHGTHIEKRKGWGIGAAIGLAAGGAIGAATYHPQCQPNSLCIDGLGRLMRGLLGGILGAVTGGTIGALGAQPTDTWVPVSVPRFQ